MRRTPQQSIYLGRSADIKRAIWLLPQHGIDPYQIPTGYHFSWAEQYYYSIRYVVLDIFGVYSGSGMRPAFYWDEALRYIQKHGGRRRAAQCAFLQLLADPWADEIVLMEAYYCWDDKSWVPDIPPHLQERFNYIVEYGADFFSMC